MNNKQGINPVTIRPLASHPGCSVVIMRMHIGLDQLGEGLASPKSTTVLKRVLNMTKYLTVALTDEEAAKRGEAVADVTKVATVDEDLFIGALGHLFPHGELVQVHWEDSKPVTSPHPPVGEALMKVITESARNYQRLFTFVKWLAGQMTDEELQARDGDDYGVTPDQTYEAFHEFIRRAREALED